MVLMHTSLSQELPKEIVKQVYTYQRLVDKMDSQIQESESGPEQRALEQKRDTMRARWADLEKKVADRKERLLDCNEKAKEYSDELNQFLPWLRSAEDRLNSLGPVLMKPNVVKRQYDILRVSSRLMIYLQAKHHLDCRRLLHQRRNGTCQVESSMWFSLRSTCLAVLKDDLKYLFCHVPIHNELLVTSLVSDGFRNCICYVRQVSCVTRTSSGKIICGNDLSELQELLLPLE